MTLYEFFSLSGVFYPVMGLCHVVAVGTLYVLSMARYANEPASQLACWAVYLGTLKLCTDQVSGRPELVVGAVVQVVVMLVFSAIATRVDAQARGSLQVTGRP